MARGRKSKRRKRKGKYSASCRKQLSGCMKGYGDPGACMREFQGCTRNRKKRR